MRNGPQGPLWTAVLNVRRFAKILMVFVIPTFAFADLPRGSHELYCPDPFDHLEAKLVFDAQAQGGAVKDGQRSAVHFVSQQREGMTGILQRQAVVKLPAFVPLTEGVEYHFGCL